MKRIEDAPKELQAMFAELWEKITILSTHKHEAAHLFLTGFDVAMATNGLKAMKPKRTIAEVHQIDDSFFVVSNDRKMFHWQGNRIGWYALPNLPQE